jgi:Tol biopolymer transport system component/DNA-binding winged helix-turn-helix (wHTH) protein
MSQLPPGASIRFAAFEVVPSRGELLKHGIRIKLPEQSYTILIALLESPTLTVSRDELRKRLWSDNTNVDFDHGLNAAVSRLREALGDSSGEPKFIETLPRRGYRFIGAFEDPSGPVAKPAPAKMKVRLPWRIGVAAVLPIAALGGGVLWQRLRVPAPPPTVRVLTSYSNSESQPSFSPDGKQVAFVWAGPDNTNVDIYVKIAGAENALRLTTRSGLDMGPAWSPDGKQIAFLRGSFTPWNPANGAPDAAVYVTSPLGGPDRKLADIPGAGVYPLAWSPDGKWLAFARAAGTSAGVYFLPVEGGEPKQVTHPVAPVTDGSPTISPDGRRLAYSRCRSAFDCDVYVQDLDAFGTPLGDARRITRQQIHIRGIAWAGDSLVYSGSLSVGLLYYLWRVGADGAGPPERMEIAGAHATYPVVSPAANRLAFVRSIRNRDIWRYTTDGVHKRLISSSLDEDSPQYSPDGKKIAFVSNRSGDAHEIWVANADGTDAVQLTNRIGRFQGSARWSPDGRWIAFDSQPVEGGQAIYIVEATGGRPRRLDLGAYRNALPNWSRDGTWIYYLSDRSGRQELWRVRPDGGDQERVTDHGGQNAVESVDGKTVYYAKENLGTPLFARALAGGPEREVIDYVGPPRDYPVFADGIYYGGRVDREGKVPLLFHSFSTGASRLITTVEPYAQNGLTVSPDRKAILYTRTVSVESDLQLIENFRTCWTCSWP